MALYERFEHLVALMRNSATATVIIALQQPIRLAFFMLLACSFTPLEHGAFRLVFYLLMTFPMVWNSTVRTSKRF